MTAIMTDEDFAPALACFMETGGDDGASDDTN